MITVTLIKKGNEPVGIEIGAGDKTYFAATDQKGWPGVMFGIFPIKYYQIFDREEILVLKEKDDEPTN